MALSKSQIQAADDLKREIVKVPEWGDSVILRCLSGIDRSDYEDKTSGIKDTGSKSGLQRVCLFLAYSMVDENGQRLFDPDSAEDLSTLQGKNNAVLMRLFARATRLSAYLIADEEEAAKKSEPSPPGDSISG